MFYIIIGILMFGLLVTFHELGHFLFAKLFKVGIYEFSIGMGPAIFSKKAKDGVSYSLRAFPIGGYVSMVGEDEDATDRPDALSKKPVWQRFIIVSAGALTNILIGILITAGLVLSEKNYSTQIERFNFADTDGNPLQITEWQGLQVGDTIIGVDSQKVRVREDLVYIAMNKADTACTLTVKRDGQTVKINDFVFPTTQSEGVLFGTINFFIPTQIPKNPLEVIRQSFLRSFATIKNTWVSLYRTVKGDFGASAVSGPVGIVSQIEKTASYGFSSLMAFIMLISMNVGVVNLLPLPALDGGRLIFLIIEAIRGKPVPVKYEAYIHLIGLCALMALMIFVTFNDIKRLILPFFGG